MSAAAIAALGMLWAHPSTAQTPGAAACTPEATGSTVDRIAASLARQVGDALGRATSGAGDVLVVSRSALPASAPRGEELVEALVGPVVAAAGGVRGVLRVERTTDTTTDVDDLAEAIGAATRGGYEHLVVVRAGLDGHYLVVQGRVVSTARRWWRRRSPPVGTRLGSPWARERLDVELRSYVGMLPPVEGARVQPRSVALPSHGYVALGVADVDGDERNEVVLLRAEALEVLRIGAPSAAARARARTAPAETPTVVARASLETIGRAPSPRRRAVGSIVLERTAQGVVMTGRTSEHALGFDARWSIERGLVVTPSAAEGYPLEACTTGRLAAGRDHFEPALGDRCATSAPVSPTVAFAPFYGRATATLQTIGGERLRVIAVTSPDATLRMRVGTVMLGAVPDAGAAVAVADVNDDGDLEVLSSSSADFGGRDRLTVRIVSPTGEQRVSWTSPELAGSVLVAGQGDVDSDGLVELLAIEEPAAGVARTSRLWIVR